jgi:hypothetical protein
MIAWVEETDVDGFNLAYAVTPETFIDFVDLVVPELQKARALQTGLRPWHAAREALRPRSGAARRGSSSGEIPLRCRSARQQVSGSDEATPCGGCRMTCPLTEATMRSLETGHPRGTEGSNPAPSSGESAANLALSIRCRWPPLPSHFSLLSPIAAPAPATGRDPDRPISTPFFLRIPSDGPNSSQMPDEAGRKSIAGLPRRRQGRAKRPANPASSPTSQSQRVGSVDLRSAQHRVWHAIFCEYVG